MKRATLAMSVKVQPPTNDVDKASPAKSVDGIGGRGKKGDYGDGTSC